MKDWLKSEKELFLVGKPKKESFGKPKKDGSGGGMRLNKGRGGCPPSKQEKFGKGMDDFTPERVVKLAASVAILGAGVKILGDL